MNCAKKLLLDIGLYNLKYDFMDWIAKKRGYISDDYEPLKCPCGSTELEDTNKDYLNECYRNTVLEYDCVCSKCGKLLGHWAYGHWDR